MKIYYPEKWYNRKSLLIAEEKGVVDILYKPRMKADALDITVWDICDLINLVGFDGGDITLR
jgi:hypothetical protein